LNGIREYFRVEPFGYILDAEHFAEWIEIFGRLSRADRYLLWYVQGARVDGGEHHFNSKN